MTPSQLHLHLLPTHRVLLASVCHECHLSTECNVNPPASTRDGQLYQRLTGTGGMWWRLGPVNNRDRWTIPTRFWFARTRLCNRDGKFGNKTKQNVINDCVSNLFSCGNTFSKTRAVSGYDDAAWHRTYGEKRTLEPAEWRTEMSRRLHNEVKWSQTTWKWFQTLLTPQVFW